MIKSTPLYQKYNDIGRNICYSMIKREKSGSEGNGSGKGKTMFTVICPGCLYLKNMKNAPLEQKSKWGVGFVCSDKNKPGKNTVVRDAGLSE